MSTMSMKAVKELGLSSSRTSPTLYRHARMLEGVD